MQNSPRSSLWKEAFLPFLDATVSCIFNLTEERHSLSWGPVRKPVFWEKPRVHLTSVWHFFVSCSVLIQLSCTKSAKWIIESFLGGCDHEVDNHCLTERLSWFLASWLFYNKEVYILWVKSIQWYFHCKIMSCLHPTCLPETVCMCFFFFYCCTLAYVCVCLCTRWKQYRDQLFKMLLHSTTKSQKTPQGLREEVKPEVHFWLLCFWLWLPAWSLLYVVTVSVSNHSCFPESQHCIIYWHLCLFIENGCQEMQENIS